MHKCLTVYKWHTIDIPNSEINKAIKHSIWVNDFIYVIIHVNTHVDDVCFIYPAST